MEGHFSMSTKERRRKSILDEVSSGRISIRQASELLGVSYRHCKRLYKRFKEKGDAGLVHQGRGRTSNRRKPPTFKERIIVRYRERYRGFGATLAAEKLAEEDLNVDHETLRRWLLASGDLKRRRKRRAYRPRREPRHHFGELVQMDGSHHRWFGPEGEQCCLINMVDDATGVTLSLLAEEETTRACMMQLWHWIGNFGIPQALYTDKKSVFATTREPTIAEELAGIMPKTAFGKACEKLGIEIIEANSPQAKGRVERNHGVYQDRFVKELSLLGVTTLAGANEVLSSGFVEGLNEKFSHAPAKEQDYHRPLAKGQDLADIFCFEDERTVQNDWVVRHDNKHYQIDEDNSPLPKPKAKVLVRTRLDGSMDIVFNGKTLRYAKLTHETLQQREQSKTKKAKKEQKIVKFTSRKPSKTPWRQGSSVMFAETETQRK